MGYNRLHAYAAFRHVQHCLLSGACQPGRALSRSSAPRRGTLPRLRKCVPMRCKNLIFSALHSTEKIVCREADSTSQTSGVEQASYAVIPGLLSNEFTSPGLANLNISVRLQLYLVCVKPENQASGNVQLTDQKSDFPFPRNPCGLVGAIPQRRTPGGD